MLSDRDETAINLVDYRVTPLQAAFLDGANVVLKTQFSVLCNRLRPTKLVLHRTFPQNS
jgi:hypothetical protein